MSINVNSAEISSLLRLFPMAIPGAKQNLLPPGVYHLGIPLGIHSPSTALFMVIDPITTLATTLAAGDSVELWVNGQATSVIKPIKLGEENDRIAMELPWGWLVNGGNTLFYRVTRLSGNFEDSTPILNVLFNNPASGITVSHPASIGPGQPATFTLKRDDPREYDVMTLTVGAWSKTIPYVHPANPVTYTLTTLDLQQIGDGTRSVSATIKDQLSNLRVSQTTPIVISANQLQVAFLNGPYTAKAGGPVVGMALSLTAAGQPVAGNIRITLPSGTVFADGTSVGDFSTGVDGKVTVTGVKAGTVQGAFSISASAGGGAVSEALTITSAFGPVGRIPVSQWPFGMELSPDENRVYVTGNLRLQEIDTTTSHLVNQIPLPQQSTSHEVAINKDGSRAYCTDADNALTVVDIENSRLVARIPLQGVPIGVSLINNDRQALVSMWNSTNVNVVDLVSQQLLKTISVGLNPRGIDIHPNGNEAYISNWNNGGSNGSISVIDTRTLMVIRTMPLTIPCYGVAVAPDGKSLFICGAMNGQGSIVQIDTSSGAVLKTILVGSYPRGIIVNHRGTHAYCTNELPPTAIEIDTASGAITRSFVVGTTPMEIKITKDDTRAFVTCANDSSVYVLSLLPGVSGSMGVASAGSNIRQPVPYDAY